MQYILDVYIRNTFWFIAYQQHLDDLRLLDVCNNVSMLVRCGFLNCWTIQQTLAVLLSRLHIPIPNCSQGETSTMNPATCNVAVCVNFSFSIENFIPVHIEFYIGFLFLLSSFHIWAADTGNEIQASALRMVAVFLPLEASPAILLAASLNFTFCGKEL